MRVFGYDTCLGQIYKLYTIYKLMIKLLYKHNFTFNAYYAYSGDGAGTIYIYIYIYQNSSIYIN